jgi:hypothetical protein
MVNESRQAGDFCSHDEVEISLDEVICGVSAMAQYTTKEGNLPREAVAEAFQDALRAVLRLRRRRVVETNR